MSNPRSSGYVSLRLLSRAVPARTSNWIQRIVNSYRPDPAPPSHFDRTKPIIDGVSILFLDCFEVYWLDILLSFLRRVYFPFLGICVPHLCSKSHHPGAFLLTFIFSIYSSRSETFFCYIMHCGRFNSCTDTLFILTNLAVSNSPDYIRN